MNSFNVSHFRLISVVHGETVKDSAIVRMECEYYETAYTRIFRTVTFSMTLSDLKKEAKAQVLGIAPLNMRSMHVPAALYNRGSGD